MYQYLILLLFFCAAIDPWQLLLKEVNIVRSHGYECGHKTMEAVDTLSWSPRLASIARQHAKYMLDNNSFSHFNRINHNHTVMRAWLESDEHCEMILYDDVTEMGAARVGDYWVVNFGKPQLAVHENNEK